MIAIKSTQPLSVRLTIFMDSMALTLPLFGYLSGNNLLALGVLNVLVPLIHFRAIYTGVDAFKHWQGRWKSAESAWILSLSNISCLMMLCLLADWYIKAGWNIIGIYDNLLWSYMNYCTSRVLVVFHRYVRAHG